MNCKIRGKYEKVKEEENAARKDSPFTSLSSQWKQWTIITCANTQRHSTTTSETQPQTVWCVAILFNKLEGRQTYIVPYALIYGNQECYLLHMEARRASYRFGVWAFLPAVMNRLLRWFRAPSFSAYSTLNHLKRRLGMAGKMNHLKRQFMTAAWITLKGNWPESP